MLSFNDSFIAMNVTPQRLAVAIAKHRPTNRWARWQPVVKMSGWCEDVTNGKWIVA